MSTITRLEASIDAQVAFLRKNDGYGTHGDKVVEEFFRKYVPAGTSAEQVWDLVDGYVRLRGSTRKNLKIVYREPPFALTIDDENGWLSPEGRFYACKYAEHRRTATWICKREPGFDALYEDTERLLEKRNWVKVQKNYGKQNFWRAPKEERQPPTSKQVQAIQERCALTGSELPWWLEDYL